MPQPPQLIEEATPYRFELRRGGQRYWIPVHVVRPATARCKFVKIQYHPWDRKQVGPRYGKRIWTLVQCVDTWHSRWLKSDEDLSRLQIQEGETERMDFPAPEHLLTTFQTLEEQYGPATHEFEIHQHGTRMWIDAWVLPTQVPRKTRIVHYGLIRKQGALLANKGMSHIRLLRNTQADLARLRQKGANSTQDHQELP